VEGRGKGEGAEEVESPSLFWRSLPRLDQSLSFSISLPKYPLFISQHSLELVRRDVEQEPRAQVIEQLQRDAGHFHGRRERASGRPLPLLSLFSLSVFFVLRSSLSFFQVKGKREKKHLKKKAVTNGILLLQKVAQRPPRFWDGGRRRPWPPFPRRRRWAGPGSFVVGQRHCSVWRRERRAVQPSPAVARSGAIAPVVVVSLGLFFLLFALPSAQAGPPEVHARRGAGLARGGPGSGLPGRGLPQERALVNAARRKPR